jgi:HSP20 family protein
MLRKLFVIQFRRQLQSIPVRLYQTAEHLMVAAPMPGLEPEDIVVNIIRDRVTIRGIERGPGQYRRDLLREEWTTGPYYREVTLPQPVDGSLTNATYGNGVLVLVMPKRDHRKPTIPAEFQLQAIESIRGERIGHSGSAIRPTTTEEHRRRKHNPTRQHHTAMNTTAHS